MGLLQDLSTDTRHEIVQFLLGNCKNGRPARGKINEAAALFHCCRKSVTRLWKTAKEQRARGELIQIVGKRFGRYMPKIHEVNVQNIQAIHYKKRGTIRALAGELKIPKTIVGRWVKLGLIRAHTNAIKPDLTAPNKLLRLSFSLQAIQFDHRNILKFKPMENVIHIDEKWFYLTKNTHRYYMTPMETESHRTCKSKKFIPKVMFMCAVSRPIFSENGSCIFDGKIGMWPFTHEIEAKRNSKKRPAGTMEIKPIESITKQVIKDCLIKQIIPAIKSKWPESLGRTIYIQQDNARPHINNSDVDFKNVANADGFHITLVQQPPNSPDVNVNDLGWFRAIQSIQHEQTCRNAQELVDAVVYSFNKLEPMTLNKVFLSLQCCLQEIMKVKGQNNYKLPHMKKNALILQNALPVNLEVPLELVLESIQYLVEQGEAAGIQGLMAEMGLEIPV